MRESSDAKAIRYLGEGRLVVQLVRGALIEATCRGGGAIYRVQHKPGRGWYCSCAARGRCAHLVALQLVTAPREEWP